MGSGISVYNNSNEVLEISLEQLSPLYWARVEPGGCMYRETGRVWFTIKVRRFKDGFYCTELMTAKTVCVTAAALASVVLAIVTLSIAGAGLVVSTGTLLFKVINNEGEVLVGKMGCFADGSKYEVVKRGKESPCFLIRKM